MSPASTDADTPSQNVTSASATSQSRTSPQESLNKFWDSLITKSPGKIFRVFPQSLYSNLLPEQITPQGLASKKGAAASYEDAAQKCRHDVARIVKECHRTNEKFTDPDFDIENDGKENCLNGLDVPPPAKDGPGGGVRSPAVGAGQLRDAIRTLMQSHILGASTSVPVDVAALQHALEDDDSDSDGELRPAAVHRVDYIFDDPSFLVDGFSSSDVQQGADGDCWWVAAVATLCSMPELMNKVCVGRDPECGVYGFVFYRDGEWISTVIDDNLYLSDPDFDARGDTYDPTGKEERRYKKQYQTGSEALYFAKCADENETWLPLLEKAYAKVHGDYDAIQGGWSGDAVEDLTGGVSTTIDTKSVLRKNILWKELLNERKEFIFGASPPVWWTSRAARQGVPLFHAYSILKAVEVAGEDDKKVRLVKIRNPWGRRNSLGVGEWTGPWSDGSKEWTPYWMKKLQHTFGDDGVFWMSYDDLCRKFARLHRTRLFGDDWMVVQQWTSVNVSWVSGYLTTKFVIEVKKEGRVVLVLSQLDERYFKGLEGQYLFQLQFLLREENAGPGEYILRADAAHSYTRRSVSAEKDLQPGIYEVVPKISATKDTTVPVVEDVVKYAAEKNPQKLRQIGLNYDIAHSKGGLEEEEGARKRQIARKAREDELRKKKLDEEKREQIEAGGDTTAKEAKQDTLVVAIESGKGDNGKRPEGEGGERSTTDEAGISDVSRPASEESKEQKRQKVKTGNEEESVEKKSGQESSAVDKADGKPLEAWDEVGKDSKEPENPWNAVAVIGLRVYSKDPDLVVTLVKPKDPEEAALLDVDGGGTGAGATT